MGSISSMDTNASSRHSMSVSMYRGGGRGGRPRRAPPDLPSLLLDARICFLGMPVSIVICFDLNFGPDDYIYRLSFLLVVLTPDIPFSDSYRLYQL
jgi:hypothetical protein